MGSRGLLFLFGFLVALRGIIVIGISGRRERVTGRRGECVSKERERQRE